LQPWWLLQLLSMLAAASSVAEQTLGQQRQSGAAGVWKQQLGTDVCSWKA
jgi:hypothetical protein